MPRGGEASMLTGPSQGEHRLAAAGNKQAQKGGSYETLQTVNDKDDDEVGWATDHE